MPILSKICVFAVNISTCPLASCCTLTFLCQLLNSHFFFPILELTSVCVYSIEGLSFFSPLPSLVVQRHNASVVIPPKHPQILPSNSFPLWGWLSQTTLHGLLLIHPIIRGPPFFSWILSHDPNWATFCCLLFVPLSLIICGFEFCRFSYYNFGSSLRLAHGFCVVRVFPPFVTLLKPDFQAAPTLWPVTFRSWLFHLLPTTLSFLFFTPPCCVFFFFLFFFVEILPGRKNG